MVFLKYVINGKYKKIKIDSIINSNENIVKINDSTYKYIIKKEEEDTFNKLLTLLKLWNKFSKKYNINYWACGGTLLGAIRHHGFIPWDNDIDISIMLSDFERIKRKLHKHHTLSYVETRFGMKIFEKTNIFPFENTTNIFPFIDIFICDYYDKSTIKFCGILSSHGKPSWLVDYEFPNQHIYKDELYPLREVEFEDTTIFVPNIQECLFRTFSNKCLNECVISNHVKRHKNADIKKNNLQRIILKCANDIEEALHIPINLKYLTKMIIFIP
jgi:hypothetical protein